MNWELPFDPKTAVLAFAAGAIAVMAVGQATIGWTFDGKVKTLVAEATQAAANTPTAAWCTAIYMNAPDSAARLVTLKAGNSYSANNDKGVVEAADQAIALVKKAGSTVNEYRVKSECGDMLFKRPLATAAK